MRSRIYFLGAGASFLLVVAAAAQGEPPREVAGDFRELLINIEDDKDDAARWERFLQTRFELSSLPQMARGFFEFCAYGVVDQRIADYLRADVDEDNARRVQTRLTFDGLPTAVCIKDRWITFDPRSFWTFSRSRWSFSIDELHLKQFSDREGCPEGYSEFIHFDLQGYLRGVVSQEIPQSQWDAPIRALTFSKSTGTTIRLVFRTPNDERRFGTSLGTVDVHTSNDFFLQCTTFIVETKSPLRLNIEDADNLHLRVNGIANDMLTGNYVHGEFKTFADRKTGEAMLNELGVLYCDDPRPRLSDDNDCRTRFQEALLQHAVFQMESIGPLLQEKRQLPNDFAEFVQTVEAESEIAYAAIESAICAGTADRIVDDPSVHWRGYKKGLGARNASICHRFLFEPLLLSSSVPLEYRIRLAALAGEQGPPEWIHGAPLGRSKADPFVLTILHARWNWPATEEELNLCRDKLRDTTWNSVEVRHAVIDSLVRWGRLDDVPPDQLEEWFQAQLAASPVRRHCTWKALTRNPAGRKFLMARLSALATQPEIQQEVASLFCHRAEATLETERWDFMTEEECRRTLKSCQPLQR